VIPNVDLFIFDMLQKLSIEHFCKFLGAGVTLTLFCKVIKVNLYSNARAVLYPLVYFSCFTIILIFLWHSN